MIVLSFLSSLVSNAGFVTDVRRTDQSVRSSPECDPSLWRLNDMGDTRIDDRSSLESIDRERSRREFPTI